MSDPVIPPNLGSFGGAMMVRSLSIQPVLRSTGTSTLTLNGSAQLLSSATPAMPVGATLAEVQPQGGDARTRIDGSTPTLTLGQIWYEGGVYTLSSAAEIAACQVIGTAGIILDITWRTA